ncbi:spherulation-specific family 4 protein [Pseudonocardia nantongensis]|uniref:spherulation-specific family 4 protein n=1 Tax=Pseudonocardia nantongensis TaxID=1181885 RepID=UPI00397B2808
MTLGVRKVRQGVPAYFHPSWAGTEWSWLTAEEGLDPVGIVVINPDTGPGAAPDDAYRSVCAAAPRPDRCVAGYVDSGYGRRSIEDVVADAAAYACFYALDAVFVDQVSSGPDELRHYRRLVVALRERGVTNVLLNPGVPPDPGYRDLADVVVEFEGSWNTYRQFIRRTLDPADTVPGRSARRWHLIHGAPPRKHADTIEWARSGAVDYVYVTDRTMPNPWDGLPSTWSTLLRGTDEWARRQ